MKGFFVFRSGWQNAALIPNISDNQYNQNSVNHLVTDLDTFISNVYEMV